MITKSGTGIIRRVDDLGRIIIPKEIRRKLKITEGTPMELFTGENGEVIFEKYKVDESPSSPVKDPKDTSHAMYDMDHAWNPDNLEHVDTVFLLKEDAEEMLREVLDDSGIKLDLLGSNIVSHMFCAESDIQALDPGQVDQRLAEAFRVESCVHLAFNTRKGLGMYVFLNMTDEDFK